MLFLELGDIVEAVLVRVLQGLFQLSYRFLVFLGLTFLLVLDCSFVLSKVLLKFFELKLKVCKLYL